MFPTGRDLQRMALATQTGILVHEASSKNILWANPTACRMFGFTVDELRPLKAHHMSGREKQYRREHGVAWLQDAVNHGSSRRRWKYRGKQDQEFLVDATATLLQFDDGPVVVVEFRPIDDEVEMEEELQRTTSYLERIMLHASAGLLLLDEDNGIQDISPFASRLFQRPRSELFGRKLDEVAHVTPSLATLDHAGALDTLANPQVVRIEIPRAGQETIWLSGNVENVDHDGIESRILVVRDITAQVRAEQERAYQEASIQYLSRYHAMGDMAMIIAHELGQPLAAATNYVSGIMSRVESGSLREQDIRYGLERCRKELARSSGIVASVKRYVQRIERTAGLHDLNAIVSDALYFVRLRSQEHDISVETQLHDGDLPIRGEQVLIGQVVLNLCFNALEEVQSASSAPPLIRVTSGSEDGYATCSVADWGGGMDDVEGDRLLESAFSNKTDGSGIGLVLCERIVTRHQGDVRIEPNHPTGTVVTIRLPLAEVQAEPEETA